MQSSTPKVPFVNTPYLNPYKDIPPGEKITFCAGCYSDDSDRQKELTQLADNTHLKPISILVRNEQRRLQQMTQNGTRQVWEQIAFCSWTADAQAEQQSSTGRRK